MTHSSCSTSLSPTGFSFNFGYGFDANDGFTTSAEVLVVTAFIELLFECVIDIFALEIEFEHGIDPKIFWDMFRVNPAAYLFRMWSESIGGIMLVLWAFRLTPTVVFCTSPGDPCSCTGGGFEIYAPFCNVTALPNGSSANTTSKTMLLQDAEKEYPGESCKGGRCVLLCSHQPLLHPRTVQAFLVP